MILHALKSISFVVEFREAMSRAVNNTEYLGHWQHEVEDLRQEEEQHGLCEVAQDSHHGKGHTRKIAESVSHEDFWREFVVLE